MYTQDAKDAVHDMLQEARSTEKPLTRVTDITVSVGMSDTWGRYVNIWLWGREAIGGYETVAEWTLYPGDSADLCSLAIALATEMQTQIRKIGKFDADMEVWNGERQLY